MSMTFAHESIVQLAARRNFSQKQCAYMQVLWTDEPELVGTLAVETFATAGGRDCIDELAPRTAQFRTPHRMHMIARSNSVSIFGNLSFTLLELQIWSEPVRSW